MQGLIWKHKVQWEQLRCKALYGNKRNSGNCLDARPYAETKGTARTACFRDHTFLQACQHDLIQWTHACRQALHARQAP
eukprot:1142354-Pelagomonas_calceolata.AAC.1